MQFLKSVRTILFFISTFFSTATIGLSQTVSTITEPLDGGTGGVCVDSEGNIYVADFGTNLGAGNTPGTKIFKVTPAGDVSIFATGLIGASGNAFDSQGNLFQSNIAANRISKITPDGTVSTFVTSGLAGPVGIAIDEEENLFVCNCNNNTIQKITAAGVSSQFASSTLFNCPNGIAMDDDGNLYVANFSNGLVLKILPDATVSLFVTVPGNNNGHITFFDGDLYVAARAANRIYKISLTGDLSLVAGNGARGTLDGPALQASFSLPNDLAFDPTGRYLYTNDVWQASSFSTLQPMVVRRIDFGTPASIDNESDFVPSGFNLRQNYPNPFNPSTTITYDLPVAAKVKVEVYNVAGEQIRILVDDQQAPGVKTVEWHGRDDSARKVASGIYYCRIRAEQFTQTRKMLLLQ